MAEEECPFLMYRGAEDHGFLVSRPTNLTTSPRKGLQVIDIMDIPTCVSDQLRHAGVHCMISSHVSCDEYRKRKSVSIAILVDVKKLKSGSFKLLHH